jgi:Haem-binding uptake, Tiki superfamily, ChaN
LSSSDRVHLPAVLSAIAPAYRTYFLQAVAAHHQLHGEQAEYFVQASHLKDDTMAESLARFLATRPGYTILALAGRFHFDYGKAMPALLQQRRQHTVMSRITAMAVAEDRVIDLQQFARDNIAHYLKFSPPVPEERSRHSTRVITLLREFWRDRLEPHQGGIGKSRNARHRQRQRFFVSMATSPQQALPLRADCPTTGAARPS